MAKTKSLGSIAGKIIPAIAPAVGAFANPADPRLGAAVTGGLANAFFPSQDVQTARTLRDLQVKGAKQSLKFGKAQEARAVAADARSQSNFEKQQTIYDEARAGQQALIWANQGGERAMNDLKKHLESFNQGSPATPDQLASISQLSSFGDYKRAVTAIGVVNELNKDPSILEDESRFSGVKRVLGVAGLNIERGEDGKFAVLDPFGSGSGEDGKWDDQDLIAASEALRMEAKLEAAHMKAIQDSNKTPAQRQFNKFATKSLNNGATPQESTAKMAEFLEKYGKHWGEVLGSMDEAAQRAGNKDIEGAAAILGNAMESLGANGIESIEFSQGPVEVPRGLQDVLMNIPTSDPWVLRNMERINEMIQAEGSGAMRHVNDFLNPEMPMQSIPAHIVRQILEEDFEKGGVVPVNHTRNMMNELRSQAMNMANVRGMDFAERQDKAIRKLVGKSVGDDGKSIGLTSADHDFIKSDANQLAMYRMILDGDFGDSETVDGEDVTNDKAISAKFAAGGLNAAMDPNGRITPRNAAQARLSGATQIKQSAFDKQEEKRLRDAKFKRNAIDPTSYGWGQGNPAGAQ